MSKKQWYAMDAKEVANALNVDREIGLSNKEAATRLQANGKNKLIAKKKDNIIFVFLRQFCDFMVMVLLGAAIISAAFGEIIDAAMIMAIIILNGILGFVQEYKAEKSLESLKELYTDEATVFRDGKKQIIPAENLVSGDVVVLNQGCKIPADLRLLQCFNMEVEESLLTGESRHVTKEIYAVDKAASLSEQKSMAFSGTTIVRGRGLGVVVATGMATEMGKIADLLTKATVEITPLQLKLKKLGKYLIAICVAVCALVSAVGIIMGGDIYTMILTGVSLGVASIPEGLPAIVTICLALGVWRLAKCNAIVKKLPAVETLGSTTVICSDKTGTLTENSMEAIALYLDGGWEKVAGFSSKSAAAKNALKVMVNCNSILENDENISGDPTEVALFNGALNIDDTIKKEKIDEEIPFDSKRRLMSVLIGSKSLVKGAPNTVLQCCNKIQQGNRSLDLDIKTKDIIRREFANYSQNGYRVLALAYKEKVNKVTEMESALTFLALVAIADPIRKDVYNALFKANTAGIKTVMITGDDKGTALSVAKELGIAKDENQVMLGSELQEVNEKSPKKALDNKRVFARVNPEDKMKIVRYYKSQGEVVAMTGDGVNDAPALKEADIGIAMGLGGTDVTKEAADFILTDDNFANIVEAVFQGRGIYDNIRKFIRYLLSSNLGEVLTMFIAVIFGFPLPLLPLQILWINLVTDGLPALALGLDKPSPSLMKAQPRKKDEGIFADGLGLKIALRGILIGVTTIFVFLYAIITYNDINISRTMAFTALVFCQLFYVFDCRSEYESTFALGIFSNIYLLLAVGISVIMQYVVLYIPWLQQVFHTVPLTLEQWGIILFVTALPTIISGIGYEIKKIVNNSIIKKEKYI
ncbi:MAG: cation-translocating P-type ATPase [Clostridiales bacterium]